MNLYDILEVSPNASIEVIKNARNALAKKYHPDAYSGNDKKYAEEKMKEINHAFDILSDEIKRTRYDDELKRNAQQSSNYQQYGSTYTHDEYKKERTSKSEESKTGSSNQYESQAKKEYNTIPNLSAVVNFRNILYLVFVGLVLGAILNFYLAYSIKQSLTDYEIQHMLQISQITTLIVKGGFAVFCVIFTYGMTRRKGLAFALGVLSLFSLIIWGVIIYLVYKSNSMLQNYEDKKFKVTGAGVSAVLIILFGGFRKYCV